VIWRLIWRNLTRGVTRNALTVLGVAIGVALIVSVNISLGTALLQMEEAAARATGNADIIVRSCVGSSFPIETIDVVRSEGEVVAAAGRVEGEGYVHHYNGSIISIAVLGVTPDDYDYVDRRYTNITGSSDLRDGGVVLDIRLGYPIGGIVKVRVRGEYYDLRVVGLYYPPPIVRGMGSIGYRAYMDIPLAQRMFRVYGRYHYIIAKISDYRSAGEVAERLQERLGPRYEVVAAKQELIERMERFLEGFKIGLRFMSILALTISSLTVFNSIYMSAKDRSYELGVLRSMGISSSGIMLQFLFEAALLGVFGGLIGVAAGIGVSTRLSAALSEYMLMPLSKIVFDPSNIALGLSAGVGVSLAGGFVPAFSAARTEIVKSLHPKMRGGGGSRSLYLLFLLGLILTGGSSYIYLTDAFGVQIRNMTPFYLATPILIFGSLLLTASLVSVFSPFVGLALRPVLGELGKLISRNIRRNLGRSVVCFALIGGVLTFYMCISSFEFNFISSIEYNVRQWFPTDIIVYSEKDVPSGFYKKLVKLDQGIYIDYAAAAMPFTTKLNNPSSGSMNFSARIMAVDLRYFPKVVKLKFSSDTPTDVYSRLQPLDTIVLSERIAENLGGLRVGSRVRVLSTEPLIIGPYVYYLPTWRSFKVVGIVTVSPALIGHASYLDSCYISYHTLHEQFGHLDDNARIFFVEVKERYRNELPLVKRRILDQYGRRYGLGILTREEVVKEIEEETISEWRIFNQILTVAYFTAIFGTATIVSLNIRERRREIAIIRSQGASKIQISVMIVAETVILSLAAVLIGSLDANIVFRGLTSLVTEYGFTMRPNFRFQSVIESVILSVLAAIVSSTIPVLLTLRMNIVEALRRD